LMRMEELAYASKGRRKMASEKNKVKRKGNDENDDDRIKKKNKSTESNEEPRHFFVNQFQAANQPLYPTATTPSLSPLLTLNFHLRRRITISNSNRLSISIRILRALPAFKLFQTTQENRKLHVTSLELIVLSQVTSSFTPPPPQPLVVLCRSELLRVPRKLLSSLLIQIARRKSFILLVSEPRFTVVSLGIDGQVDMKPIYGIIAGEEKQQQQTQHQHQDLKSITGFQAFSNNSGSEVDDSGSIGKSQAACNEFGTHCVESGNEFVYSTAAATASGALSLGVAQSSEEIAIVVADSDSSKKIVDTFGQRTSIYRGVTRHRWTVLKTFLISWRLKPAFSFKKQLKDLCKHPVDGFSAGLVDESSIFEWSVTIIGPPDTLYEGRFFNAIMSFPSNYPNSPPSVKFTSEIWHPNVYPDGRVCISILHPPADDPNGYEFASVRWTPVHT
ncbi:hypothetical protein RYX36_007206, partial [Vicia faba]